MRHGRSGYNNGCRCTVCRRAWREYARQYKGSVVPDDRDDKLDNPWLLVNFPVAIVARKAWPDDAAAIAAAFPSEAQRAKRVGR